MPSLREIMADNGYESNDDYSYHVRCLLSSQSNDIRCLNIEGTAGRRKTAFANALAHALDYNHVLYHDFSRDIAVEHTEDAEPETSVDEPGKDKRVSPFDSIMSDTCAFSEGDRTILILDQLQAAPFAEHIRLYKFIRSHEWHTADTQFFANKGKLLLFLISEEALYHSLQKHSFRVWVSGTSIGGNSYRAEDFRLESDIQPVIEALRNLFLAIGVMPTYSEFGKILNDIQINVRTREELIHSIFGWTEGIDQDVLHSSEINQHLMTTMGAVENFIGVDEVELSFANFSVPE
ncbi:MAG: hypothetical protein AAF420_01940 [Pseudomonadota bacterium]